MQAVLSFTKQPAINPVATAVLAQLIKKGKSVEDAIIGVKAFFKQTALISGKELGVNTAPRSRPGQQPFNNNAIDTDEEEEVEHTYELSKGLDTSLRLRRRALASEPPTRACGGRCWPRG